MIGLKSSVERGISCCVHLYLAGFGTQGGFSTRGGRFRFQREINPVCHCLLWSFKSDALIAPLVLWLSLLKQLIASSLDFILTFPVIKRGLKHERVCGCLLSCLLFTSLLNKLLQFYQLYILCAVDELPEHPGNDVITTCCHSYIDGQQGRILCFIVLIGLK